MNERSPLPEAVSTAAPAEKGAGTIARLALAPVILLGVAGCTALGNLPKDPVPVSVSAANYSRLSDEELYARLHDPTNAPTKPPAAPEPPKPLYYLPLAGEVYPCDVPLETVYRELEVVLEPRGYFNADYQTKAGHTPPRVDYLLRIHYGERQWLNPIVRGDKVTWGNDGLVADRYKTKLMSDSSYDPRTGLTPSEVAAIERLFGSLMAGNGGQSSKLSERMAGGANSNSFGSDQKLWRDFGETGQRARNFYLVVVEAFRLDEVTARNNKAPCIWATFIAVPVDQGQRFSDVLPSMLQAAVPYFGETTSGLQVYEVPPGKVLVGTSVEVPDAEKAHQP